MRNGLLFFLLCFMLILPTVLPAQTHICADCQKPILKGAVLQVGDAFYHPEHFRCAACRTVIENEFIENDGGYYHATCYQETVLPRCAVCDQPLTGKYMQAEGSNYHRQCYDEKIARRCAVCDQPIHGKYILDYWGNSYHKEHENNVPKCDYCSRFIADNLTGGGYEYGDGRKVCGLCYQIALSNLDDVRVLFEEVRRRMEKYDLTIPLTKIPLRLVDRRQMQRISPEGNRDVTGFTHLERSYVNDKVASAEYEILLLTGMPRYLFISTAAHELMHVWIHEYGGQGLPEDVVEGSCNYASSMILNEFSGERAGFRLQNLQESPDPVYGGGYRKIREYVNRYGRTAWLNMLRGR
jgi:hypothetical protein